MTMALEGIFVLDLTRVLAGPYTTMVLADLGADVIKIEIPDVGDDSRQFGPYINGESAYFLSLNRNKKSITLNLKHAEAKQIFLTLSKEADVVVENFRPGTMEKLGLGYDQLSQQNHRLIYAAASGFGHTGPYSRRPAYDAIVQAMGGLMSITGQEGGQPTRAGTSIGDITAGLFTAIGINAALYHREKTGQGQKIDVAMLDSQVAILENAIARYLVTGDIPQPIGNKHPSIAPFESFDTRDGSIMIAVGNDRLWMQFCQACHLGSLAIDESFSTNSMRVQNYSILRPIIAERIREKSTEEWQETLDSHGVPSSPINTIDKLLEHPQIQAREMIIDSVHPRAGEVKITGSPIKMSKTPPSIRTAAPILGQHTEDILVSLGYSESQIASLRQQGAI